MGRPRKNKIEDNGDKGKGPRETYPEVKRFEAGIDRVTTRDPAPVTRDPAPAAAPLDPAGAPAAAAPGPAGDLHRQTPLIIRVAVPKCLNCGHTVFRCGGTSRPNISTLEMLRYRQCGNCGRSFWLAVPMSPIQKAFYTAMP